MTRRLMQYRETSVLNRTLQRMANYEAYGIYQEDSALPPHLTKSKDRYGEDERLTIHGIRKQHLGRGEGEGRGGEKLTAPTSAATEEAHKIDVAAGANETEAAGDEIEESAIGGQNQQIVAADEEEVQYDMEAGQQTASTDENTDDSQPAGITRRQVRCPVCARRC